MTGFIILLLAGAFFYMIYQQAVNIPYVDDFAFFDYTLRMMDANDFGAFWNVVWARHSEHRIVLTKLSFWMQYALTGQLNFRQKILVETYFIWSFFGVFWYTFRKNTVPFLYLLPVALILFSPIYYMDVFWNMTTWQHIGSALLISLCFYFLCTLSRRAFAAALLLGVLVTLSNGNGWLCLFTGGVLLLFQKRYRTLLIWLGFCTVLAIICLMGNVPMHYHQLSPLYVFQTICVFLGSTFFFLRGHQPDNFYGGLALLLMGAILLSVLFLVNRNLLKGSKAAIAVSNKITQSAANLSMVGVIACMFLTAVGAGLLRQSTEFAIWPHYMVYSVFTVLFTYALTIILLPNQYRPLAGGVGVVLATLVAIGGLLWAFPDLEVFRKQLLADAFKLRNEQPTGKPIVYVNPVTIGQSRYREAVQHGLHHLPSTPFDGLAAHVFGQSIDSALLSKNYALQIVNDPDTGRTIGLSNDSLPVGGRHLVYVILKNAEETYLIAPKPNLLSNRRVLLSTGQLYRNGFTVNLFVTNYTTGVYDIGLILPEKEGYRVVYTGQQITVRNPDPVKG